MSKLKLVKRGEGEEPTLQEAMGLIVSLMLKVETLSNKNEKQEKELNEIKENFEKFKEDTESSIWDLERIRRR